MSHLLTRKQCLISMAFYLAFAIAVLCTAPFIGSTSIKASRVISEIKIDSAGWSTDTKIFIDQRLPRVLLGFLVGGSLALVGSVFQVIFRNPLAAPSTLGITAGGAVGAALAISVAPLTRNFGPFSSVQLFLQAFSPFSLLLQELPFQ